MGFVFTTSPVSEMAGPDPDHPLARSFLHGLQTLGYVEGRNLVLERRSAEGKFERFREILEELVSLKADVIVVAGNDLTQRAKEVTTTVPIVMGSSFNPVESGLVASLARPGGNVTGVTSTAGPEIEGKRVELLKEILPKIRRVAFLDTKPNWEGPFGYDEYGGRWDHVPPPPADRWGPGARVPAIIISPHAKRRYVDHTLYDTTSILKFIEVRWGLRPLGPRDAAANDLTNAFDLS